MRREALAQRRRGGRSWRRLSGLAVEARSLLPTIARPVPRPMPAPPAFGHRHHARTKQRGIEACLRLGGLRRRMDRRRRFDAAPTTPPSALAALGAQRRSRSRTGPASAPRSSAPSTAPPAAGCFRSTPTSGSRARRSRGEHPRRRSSARARRRRRPTSCRACRASAAAGSATATGIRTGVLRLFRRDRARFSPDRVHERVVVEGGPPGRLEGELLHDTMPSLDDALAKMNRYSSEPRAQRAARRAARRPGRGARPCRRGPSCAATSSRARLPRRRRRLRACDLCRGRYLLAIPENRGARHATCQPRADPTFIGVNQPPHCGSGPCHVHRRRVFSRRATAPLSSPPPAGRSSGSRSPASARTQLPIAIARFRDEDKAGQSIVGHRARRPRAQRRVPHRRRGRRRSTRRSAPGDGASGAAAAPMRWSAGSVDAPGRWPLRRALQAVGRGQGQRPRRPEQRRRRRPTCAWRRTASPTPSTRSSPARRACSRPASPTSRAAANRYTLRVADADGEGGQVALNSAEPIISPAWSPDGRELAYVSFETQKAVVCVQDVASGERRAIANFRGCNSAPAWSPDGQHAGRDAVARRRLAALPDRPQRRQPAPPHAAARRSTPSRCSRPTAAASTSSATAAAARRSTACRRGGGNAERVTFTGSYNISPAISPDGRTLAYITRSGNAFRLTAMDLGRRRAAQRAHRHQRRREPELRAQRQADHLCHARAGARRVDDHHARWQDQGAPAVARRPMCASRSGALSADDVEPHREFTASEGEAMNDHRIDTSLARAGRAWLAGCVLERQARRAGAGRDRAPARAPAPGAGAGARRRRGTRSRGRPRSTSPATSAAGSATSPRIVYFDFDSYVVKDEFRPVIEAQRQAR